MKRNLFPLFLTAILMMVSCNQVEPDGTPAAESVDWTKAFKHQSLLMNFTGSTCGWCPGMNAAIQKAQEDNPGLFQLLCIHGSYSVYPFADKGQLFNQYNVTGMPTGIVDGRRVVNREEVNTTAAKIAGFMKETEDLYPVSSAVSYQSAFSGQRLDLHLFLYLKAAADYKVSVFLTEDGIVGMQKNYLGDDLDPYVHNNVARVSISNPLGDAFTTTAENSIKRFDYSVTVPEEYVKDNLKILVFVQRSFGTQTVVSDGFVDYYIDNCAVGKAGAGLSLE